MMKLITLSMVCVLLSACANKTLTTSNNIVLNVGRTMGERVTDTSIERKTLAGLANVAGLTPTNHRIAINTYQSATLLTGEVPNLAVADAVARMAASISPTRTVYNYLIVSEPKSQAHSTLEGYLKSKIISKALMQNVLNANQYEIVVRNDTAYVLGVLSAEQAGALQNIVMHTDGMLGYVSFAQVYMESQAPIIQNPAQTTGTINPQTMPIGNTVNTGQGGYFAN